MSEEKDQVNIMRQIAILIYNQPAVQEALTAISKAVRTREALTEAGVNFVQAVSETAMAFSQNHEAMAAAVTATPKSAADAATRPGIYPAASICDGDTILHGGVDRVVAKVLAGRDEIQFTLENGGVVSVMPETQITLVRPYEPEI